MKIRRLTAGDACAFHALRLDALRDAPSAFGSSYEEEKDLPLAVLEERLASRADRGVFGAFSGDTLVGLVALGREDRRKSIHKAFIWGMYVEPAYRGQGIARQLLAEALVLARLIDVVRQVHLSVNAANQGAIRLYASFGFVAYGHEIGAMLIDGELHDEIHMCLVLNRDQVPVQ